MARNKTGFIATEDQPLLDISSLIDVCFLLLIYFIVTSQIVPQEKDLPMTMPSGPSSELRGEPVLVAVRPDGAIWVNKNEPLDSGASGRERSLPMLTSRLNEFRAMVESSGHNPAIMVQIDGDCPQQAVIDVLNCFRGANINNLIFIDSE